MKTEKPEFIVIRVDHSTQFDRIQEIAQNFNLSISPSILFKNKRPFYIEFLPKDFGSDYNLIALDDISCAEDNSKYMSNKEFFELYGHKKHDVSVVSKDNIKEQYRDGSKEVKEVLKSLHPEVIGEMEDELARFACKSEEPKDPYILDNDCELVHDVQIGLGVVPEKYYQKSLLLREKDYKFELIDHPDVPNHKLLIAKRK